MTLAEIREGSVLLFDKPFDWSSYDLVRKVVRLTHAKVGHAGTLDPYATGLMILCTGKFTKKISGFQNLEKEYTGTMVVGATTPSFDLETEVEQQFETNHINESSVRAVIPEFCGEILQSPPVFSAIMIEGKRAYKKARVGEVFELQKRKVIVHELEITGVHLPQISFRIVCGKGFYVRSFVNDLGRALKSGAYLSSLCRRRIGHYHLDDAWQINDFAKFAEAQKKSE